MNNTGGGKGRRKRPEKVVVRLSSGLSILGDSHRSERAGCVFSVFKSRFGEMAIPERFLAFFRWPSEPLATLGCSDMSASLRFLPLPFILFRPFPSLYSISEACTDLFAFLALCQSFTSQIRP